MNLDFEFEKGKHKGRSLINILKFEDNIIHIT